METNDKLNEKNLNEVSGGNSEDVFSSYKINQSKCVKCGSCYSSCFVDAITTEGDYYEIVEELCTGCGVCESACPAGAIYQ